MDINQKICCATSLPIAAAAAVAGVIVGAGLRSAHKVQLFGALSLSLSVLLSPSPPS